MNSSHNKERVCQMLAEIFEARNYDAIDEMIAPAFVDHEDIANPRGREHLKPYFAALHTAFPDLTHTVESSIAEGDHVALRSIWRGTQTGEFMGMPPSGKKVCVEGMTFWRVKDGKVVDRWALLDRPTLMQQLQAPTT